MAARQDQKLEVFFDGSCQVCRRGMWHYRRLDGDHLLLMIDISAAEFSAQDYGLDGDALQAELHVRDHSGCIFTAVDAFGQIWWRLPGWRFSLLRRVIAWWPIRPLLKWGYVIFARHRLHWFGGGGSCRGRNMGEGEQN